MIRPSLIAAGLVLAACQAQPPEPAPAGARPDATGPAARPADEAVFARYACAEGNTVDLIREGRVARLSLSDGRTLRLGEMAGSHPRTWADVGLRFVIDGEHVELAQANGERSLPCQPADSP